MWLVKCGHIEGRDSRHVVYVSMSIWLMSPGASAEDIYRHNCLHDVRSVLGAYTAWRHLRHVLTISVQYVIVTETLKRPVPVI